MAGFTCTICGGSIKMNANQTGVCQGCGMEYDIEAIRAMAGAPAQNAPAVAAPAPTAPQAAQDEIDRDALITYLSDVRVMETLIVKDNEAIAKLSNQLGSQQRSVYSGVIAPVQPEKPVEPDFKLTEKQEHDAKVGKRSVIVLLIFSVVLTVIMFAVGGFFGVFMGICCLIMSLIALMLVAASISVDKSNDKIKYEAMQKYQEESEKYTKYLMPAYENKLRDYHDKKREADEKMTKLRADTDQHKTEIHDEIDEIKSTLQKAYSANIIPQQFRNIEGVYYLYDYLSTSKQSLSEALLQANLEAIKQKLDNMIKLQSVQIIQQAQTNAKLDTMKAQNDRLLELSEATMNNTAVAAQYAQIAAVNSELSVKLAAEQLAYQKAEFWLK